jgi:hypothetical protein
MHFRILVTAATAVLCLAAVASGQLANSFTPARFHPAIAYATAPTDDPVARLAARLRGGEVTLTFEPGTGYLRSLLEALNILPESQVLVFSKSSFQAPLITPQNPRSLFFTDNVAVGYVRGGEVIEVAAQDPRQGTIFYTLPQSAGAPQAFTRNAACVSCHVSDATADVPGMFAASAFVAPKGEMLYVPVYTTDHRTPFELRWGGYYVTGRHGSMRHLGNAINKGETELDGTIKDADQNLTSLDGRVDLSGYLRQTSDIVSLLVWEHQMHLANLFTRAAWEHRLATPEARQMKVADTGPAADSVIAATRVGAAGARSLTLRPARETAVEIVDYMLFVDEAPLEGRVEGVSGFAERFSRQGPRDSKGRSLRDLDLTTRLMRYPCSYLIYSEAFDALPTEVRDAVYARLWEVLSGADTQKTYASRLSLADRQAVVDILRETKPGLPGYFQAVTR